MWLQNGMLQSVFLYCRPHKLRLWIITGPVKAKLGHFFILSLTLNQAEFYAILRDMYHRINYLCVL